MVFIYKTYNPINSLLFPTCPFLKLTNYKCAGCGSQRTIHYLLNLEFKNALKENVLLVMSIPYVLLGTFYNLKTSLTTKQLKWRRKLFGVKAIFSIFIVIILFWILRNTSYLPFFN